MFARMPEDWPNNMPEDMLDRMPEDLPNNMPEDMLDRMPDRMPEDMPEDMPDKMSDRKPEDLPVTKCINVMVGITRSMFFCFCLRCLSLGFLQQWDKLHVRFSLNTCFLIKK